MSSQHPHPESDRGSTFIEILVAVVLLGVAGVAVLTALGAAAAGAAVNRSVSDAQAALATAGDALTDTQSEVAEDNYLDCDTNTESQIVAAYTAVVAAVSTGIDVADVEYWSGTGWDTSACAFGSGERLQRITLSAVADGATKTLQVVKRPMTDPTVGVGPLPPGASGAGPDVEIEHTPGLDGP